MQESAFSHTCHPEPAVAVWVDGWAVRRRTAKDPLPETRKGRGRRWLKIRARPSRFQEGGPSPSSAAPPPTRPSGYGRLRMTGDLKNARELRNRRQRLDPLEPSVEMMVLRADTRENAASRVRTTVPAMRRRVEPAPVPRCLYAGAVCRCAHVVKTWGHGTDPLGPSHRPLGPSHRPLGPSHQPPGSKPPPPGSKPPPPGSKPPPPGSKPPTPGSKPPPPWVQATDPWVQATNPLGPSHQPLGPSHRPLGPSHHPRGSKPPTPGPATSIAWQRDTRRRTRGTP